MASKLIQEFTRLTKDQHAWLEAKKQATGMSKAQILRDALNEKMQRENGHKKGVRHAK